MNVCSSKQGLGFVGGEALSYSLEVALIGDRYWPLVTPEFRDSIPCLCHTN